jgi:hypothetical protein
MHNYRCENLKSYICFNVFFDGFLKSKAGKVQTYMLYLPRPLILTVK